MASAPVAPPVSKARSRPGVRLALILAVAACPGGRTAHAGGQGDLDAALSTWTEFLDCSDGIRSVKISEAAEDMSTRLDRHCSVPEADALVQRAKPLLKPLT